MFLRKLLLSATLAGLLATSATSQTLFTFGNTPVDKAEFLRVYQKNALNKKPDLSEAALNEYFDLYTLFKMKVHEAESRRIDTIPAIQRELENYRKQLAKNYLTDEELNKKLVLEAYDRMKEERRVSHILLTANSNTSPEDTLELFQRADSIYNAIVSKKAKFEDLARSLSNDNGTKDQGGDLGFMTALQSIYSFENQVYNTAPGQIARPFRTQLGYHIIKVTDKRPARGEIQVAHILLTTPKSAGDAGEKLALKRIDSIKIALKQGVSFEDLARQYSQDKFSINDGGVLKPFSVGRMTPAFEDAAFSLKNKGDVSEPVKTEYGYHLIKLISRTPIKPYDSMANSLKKQVDNDSRAQTARDAFFERIKQRNGFKEYPANLEALIALFNQKVTDTGKSANMFKGSDFANANKPLFSMAKSEYLQSDYMNFAETLTRGRMTGQRKNSMNEIYKMYVDKVVNDAEEKRLLVENPEFKNLMQEYRDGIMLFELMDQQVWGKASRDTAGLQAFYEQNKGKYQWEPGFTGSVYRFKNAEALKAGMAIINDKDADQEDQSIADQVNTDAMPDGLQVMQGRYEFAKFKDVPRADLVAGTVSKPNKNADGTYTVVRVKELYEQPEPKTLEDARGYVIAEYQDYLEKEWNASLRARYPVKKDQAVFKSMIK
jgi:peptidyl-prolyl cis-trans isomerase SurA